jgi:NADPH2:quinone reductase
MAVNYGNASGHVPPLDLLLLAKRSLSVSRPGLSTYIRDTETMRTAAVELFELVMGGTIKVEIGNSYALKDAASAHRDLEARKSTGSLLLLPSPFGRPALCRASTSCRQDQLESRWPTSGVKIGARAFARP